MPLGPCRPAIDAPGAEMRSKWRLPASSRSSRFGRGRRKPDWGSMSEGMSPGMVGDAPAGVKAVQQMLMLQSSEMEAAERIPGGMRAREVAAYLKAIPQ